MNSVVLHTKTVVHQKTYRYEIELEASDIGLSKEGWAWAAWVQTAFRSEILPISSGEVEAVIRAFKLIKDSSEAQILLAIPLEALRLSTVCRFYELLEFQIATRADSLSCISKHHLSLRTRRLLNRFLEAVGLESIHRIRSVFKTSLPNPKTGRALISDKPIFAGGQLHEPIGAISHLTAEDLRRQTSRILTLPLEQIAAACVSQIDQYERLENWKTEMLRATPDKAVLARLEAIGKKQPNKGEYVWVKKVSIHTLTVAYLHLLYERLPRKGVAAPRQILRRLEIDAFIEQTLGSLQTGMRWVSPVPQAGQNLLACLLILQIHSHWNVNSVLELTLRSLSSVEPPLVMQGFKSRTKTTTPIVSIERGDLAARALRFLINRLEWLKKMRWVAKTEERLWLNLSGQPFVGWGAMLKRFQAKWGLPQFSLEQIRAQTLAAQSVQVGGLALTKNSAGHASLRSTSIYVDKLLVCRLNSSANLEFQRRLEADVRTVINGGKARYLYPIGDGASCTNPQEPPFESDIEGGVCAAQRCHVGEGCPNRRIVLNDDRVEEVVRTAIYYRNNWVRLYERNPEAFETFHVPSMNFNFALLGMLRRGSYAHLVRAAEAALAKPDGHRYG